LKLEGRIETGVYGSRMVTRENGVIHFPMEGCIAHPPVVCLHPH